MTLPNKNPLPLILIVGAMDSELSLLLKTLNAYEHKKILNFFPLYKAKHDLFNVNILKTFVGEHNALLAGYEAIKELNPDLIIKFGAVGGSYSESKVGDIIVPLGYFHRTSWITRTKSQDKPTSDASMWQSLFGDLPYQVNSVNLGGMPYFFPSSKKLIKYCQKSLEKLNIDYIKAYVGGGNMWMFDKKVLDNVADTLLPKNPETRKFISDMESYSLAYVSHLLHRPFTGCYIVASNDYLDETYDPSSVSDLMEKLIPYTLLLIEYFKI